MSPIGLRLKLSAAKKRPLSPRLVDRDCSFEQLLFTAKLLFCVRFFIILLLVWSSFFVASLLCMLPLYIVKWQNTGAHFWAVFTRRRRRFVVKMGQLYSRLSLSLSTLPPSTWSICIISLTIPSTAVGDERRSRGNLQFHRATDAGGGADSGPCTGVRLLLLCIMTIIRYSANHKTRWRHLHVTDNQDGAVGRALTHARSVPRVGRRIDPPRFVAECRQFQIKSNQTVKITAT